MKTKSIYLRSVMFMIMLLLTDVTVFAQAPAPPGNFMAIPVSSSSIDLTWMDGPEEINYVLERSDGDSLNYNQIAVIDMDSTSYSDTGLQANTEYYYKIKAVGMIEDSPYSYAFIVTPQDPSPSIPNNFSAIAFSATQVDLSWGDSDIETSYVIERSLSELSGYSQIATPVANTTSYSDTNLSSQTTYYYKIKAVGANGDSDYALTSETTQAHPVPNTPAMFMASAVSFSQIDLSWTDVQDEEGYTIQRSTTSGSGYATIATLDPNDSTYSDTGLSGSTTYYYQIKANGIDQDSPYSTEIMEMTPSAVPDVPANFQAMAASATQIDLSWVDVMTETGYTLEGSDDGGSNYDPLATLSADVTSYSVTDLNEQTTYDFRLRATNANGSSAFTFANETTPAHPIPPKPTNLIFSSLTNNSMTLSWDDGPDEEGYTLERKLLSDTVFILVANLNEDDNDHDDSGLSSGTTYEYRVKANGINQDSDYSDEISVTTAPDVPANFSKQIDFNTPGNIEITLSWSDVTGENSYLIERSVDDDSNYQPLHAPIANATQFIDLNVSANTVYYYRIKAVGPDAESGYYTLNFTTPPDAPANLSLIAVNMNRVDLNWDDVNGETSYRIQRSTTSGSGFSTINTPFANVTTYTDNSVSGNTTYYYQIQSRNTSNGNSPYSNEVSILTQPDVPSNFSASVISNEQIDLSWDDMGAEVTYTVERSQTSGSGFLALTTIPSTTLTDSPLAANTIYYYRIKAQNESGASAYSSEIIVTTAPAIPSILAGNAASESQIDISWDDVAAETAYTIQRSTQQGTGFSDIGTNSANDTTFSDSNLSANTAYYYRVRSGNANGNSLYSGEIEVTTAPAPPTNLSATATSDANLQLSWDPSTGATNYTIERSTISGSGFSQIAIENAGIYNDGALNANTTYYYRLKASNTHGSSSYSSEFSGLTLLQKPTGLMADSNYGNELEMEWNGVTGAVAYQLERKDDANPSFTIVATVNGQTSTWVTDSGLQYGTAYTYRLKALSSGNVNDSDYSDEVTIVTHPDKPANVSASVISATQIDLSWDDVTGETEYLVQRSQASGSGFSTVRTLSANAIGYSDTNLEDNTTYYYQILARNSGGDSDPSDEVSGLTLIHTPTDLEADSIYGTQVDLVWGEVTHNNGFIIERKDDANPTFTQVGTNTVNDRYFTDTGLNYGTDYTYRVKAIGPNGNDSHYSAELDILTIPITPQNFAGSHSEIQTEASNPWEVNLTWNDGVGETSYTVERSFTGESNFNVLSNKSAGVTTHNDDNSGDGFAYNGLVSYRIKASNSSGSSPYSEITIRMRTDKPTGLSINAVSYDQIDLSWNDVTGDTAYIIERSITSGSGFSQIGTTSADDTDYSDTSVQSNTTYYYRIISVNAGGNSQHSSEQSATTPIETPVVTLSVVSSIQLDLSWADVSGEDNYIIERSTTSGSGYSALDTLGSNATSYTNSGLSFNTTYYYRVKAVSASNSSEYSSEVNGLTLLETPYNFGLDGPSAVTGNEMYLDWKGNHDIELTYILERKLENEADYSVIDSIVKTVVSNSNVGYTDFTIDYATTYNYRIKATDPSTGNYSEYSDVYWVRTSPADVSNFIVTAQYFDNGDGTYRMQSVSSWDDVIGEYQYELTKGTNSNKFLSQELITKLDSNTTTYTEDSLAFNEMYWYRIRAIGDQSLSYDVGNSDPVYVQFFTPTTVPTGLSASTTSSSSIDLSWTDVDGDTAYVLERSLTSGSGFSVIATLGEDVTSYTDNTVSANTTYQYRVKSMSLGGASIYSEEVSTTTLTDNVQNLSGTPEIVDNGDGSYNLQIHLKWVDLSNDHGYKIHQSTVGPYTELNTNVQDDTTYSDTNLFYNVYYYYKVRGINSEGAVASLNNTDVLIVQTPTDVPTGLTANVTSPTSIDLNWTDVNGDTAYVIERSLTSGSGFSVIGTNASNDVTFTNAGLTPGTTYYYRVKAVNGGGDSRYSDEISATTPPETPVGLIATAVSADRIDLTWNDVEGEINYIIERALSDTGTFIPIASISANDTTQADLALDAGTQYFYRVKASANGVDSDYSNVVFAFTLVDTPTNFSGQTVSTIQIDLSWDDVDGELGYILERADSLGGDFLPVGMIMADSTSYSDADLQFSHTYYYRLAANGPAGDSPYTNTLTITTLAPVPEIPMNFMANAISANEILLSWDNGLDESGYTLERSLTQGSGYSVIANLAADSVLYSDTGLNANTTYYYRLKANGTAGDSDYALVEATTLNYLMPEIPVGFMVLIDSNQNVEINWIDVENETSYSIERSVNNDSSFTVLSSPSANETSYTDSNASEGNAYFYRMKAINNTVSSAYTNIESAIIPLNAPTGLSSSVVSNNQVDLSWTDNSSGETGFVIQRSLFPNDYNNAVNFNVSANANSYSDTTAQQGVDYFYRVYATGSNLNSEVSNEVHVKIKITPTISWNNPTSITVGTPLGQNQLNASANAHGSFNYSPSFGTILTAGNHTLSVDFVPADTLTYNSVSGTTVSITVNGIEVPSNFSASVITPNHIDLSWDDVNINTGYVIERSTTSGSGFAVIANRSDNSIFYSDMSVVASTTYYYRIKAVYNNASSDYSSEVAVSTTTTAPDNFSANLISDNQVDLSWDDISGESSYTIQRSVDDNSNFSDLNSPSANATAYSDNTIIAGNTYFYRIRANNGGGSSQYSPEVFVQTSCGTPTNTSSSAIGDNTVTINWDAVSGANSYEIVYGQLGAGLNSVIAGANDTNVTINGLYSGSNYQWRIRTICTDNEVLSGFTTFQYFSTTGGAACEEPTGTSVTGIGAATATFNWTEPTGADSYEIQYGVHGSNTLNVITASAGNTSVNLTGLFMGTSYQVRIRTICTAGQLHSQWSDFIYFSTIGAAACESPTGISVTGIGNNSATFNWTEPSGGASYEIVYGVLGSGLNDLTASAGTTSVNLTGLFSGTTYQVRIRTICTSGQLHSEYTNFIYFTTTGSEACSFPANLNTTGIGNAQATANWDVVAGADSYHIVYGIVGGGLNDHYVAGGASVSSVISGLTASSNYRWRMRTICNTGQLQSGWSDWDYFTTSASSSIINDTETTARIKTLTDNTFKVYPNPSNGYVNILMDQPGEDKIQLLVYNSVGKLVFTSIHDQSLKQRINLKEFGTGLFLIKVNTQDNSQIKRVVIK